MTPTILYEDGEALVIDKPAGLPVERPRKGGECLEDHLDALRLGFQRAPVPVHRIDTDTSGCLLLARNPKALKRFNKAFEDRQVAKTYLAVLAGHPEGTSGTIRLKLAKISSEAKGWRMIAARKGKEAVSHWELVQELGPHALIRFRPETGRTHQLRVHAHKGLGAPLLGDPVYGSESQRGRGAARTMLHASGLVIAREGKPPIEAHAPLPADFVALGVVEPGAGPGGDDG
ncbi:MAG: RNA pseudouridine synthase [Erythrobacter sp.]|jgi:tRNA pseudouridine32 synthase/23S rRNA pseudouridine746 synthase|nr:RNA pseudouridine synthase [Erythrobacter sp.]